MVAHRLKNGCYRKQIHALPLKFNSQSMSDQASRQYYAEGIVKQRNFG